MVVIGLPPSLARQDESSKSPSMRLVRISSAGSVKITPVAIDVPAEAPVATMLFSRMCPPPSSFSTAIDTTAAGIAEAIVIPANSPR